MLLVVCFADRTMVCPGVKHKLADDEQIGKKDVHGKKDERPRASAAHTYASARTQERGVRW